jgi:hypothetical protein
MLQQIVGNDSIERFIRVRECFSITYAPVMKVWIVSNTPIQVDAVDRCGCGPHIHLAHDPRTSAEAKNVFRHSQPAQDTFAQHRIVPVSAHARVERVVKQRHKLTNDHLYELAKS